MVTTVHKLQGAGGIGGADSYWIALAGIQFYDDFSADCNAIDVSGNVASVGRTQVTDREAVIVVRDPDGAVVYDKKFSYSGQTVQFNCCVFDSAGNLYAAGYKNNNKFIVKLNSSGTVQWQKEYTSVSLAYCQTLIIDDSDNVYVAGRAEVSGFYAFIAKVNTSTGAFIWTNYSGLSTKNTHIYSSTGATFDSSSGMFYTIAHRDIGTDYSAIVQKYNSSGVIQSSSQIDFTSGSSNYEEARSICLDQSGNLIVTSNDYTYYGFISKLPNTLGGGALTWAKSVSISGSSVNINGLAVDSGDNIYICGTQTGSNTHAVIAKFNSSGVLQWANTIGGTGGATGDTYLYKLTVKNANTIIVSGATGADGTGYGRDGLTMQIPSDGSGTGTYGSLIYQSASLTVATTSPAVSSPTINLGTPGDTDANAGTTVGSWTYTEELLPITI